MASEPLSSDVDLASGEKVSEKQYKQSFLNRKKAEIRKKSKVKSHGSTQDSQGEFPRDPLASGEDENDGDTCVKSNQEEDKDDVNDSVNSDHFSSFSNPWNSSMIRAGISQLARHVVRHSRSVWMQVPYTLVSDAALRLPQPPTGATAREAEDIPVGAVTSGRSALIAQGSTNTNDQSCPVDPVLLRAEGPSGHEEAVPTNYSYLNSNPLKAEFPADQDVAQRQKPVPSSLDAVQQSVWDMLPFAHSETDDFVNDGPNNNRPQTSFEGRQALGHGPIGTAERAKEVMNSNWNAPSEEATETQKGNRVKDSLDSTSGYAGSSAGSNIPCRDGEQEPLDMERVTETTNGLKDAVVSEFDDTDQTISTDSIPVSQKVNGSAVPVRDLTANAIDSGDQEFFSDETAVSAKTSEARGAGSEQIYPDDKGKGLAEFPPDHFEFWVQDGPRARPRDSRHKANVVGSLHYNHNYLPWNRKIHPLWRGSIKTQSEQDRGVKLRESSSIGSMTPRIPLNDFSNVTCADAFQQSDWDMLPFAHSETDDSVYDGPNNNRPQMSFDCGQALGHSTFGTVEGAKEVMNANWNAPSEGPAWTEKADCLVKDAFASSFVYAGNSAGSNLPSSDGEQQPFVELVTETASGLKDAVLSKFDHADQTTSTDSIPVPQKVSDSGVPVKDLFANAIDSGDQELFSEATLVSAKAEATLDAKETASEQTIDPDGQGKGLSDSITKSIADLPSILSSTLGLRGVSPTSPSPTIAIATQPAYGLNNDSADASTADISVGAVAPGAPIDDKENKVLGSWVVGTLHFENNELVWRPTRSFTTHSEQDRGVTLLNSSSLSTMTQSISSNDFSKLSSGDHALLWEIFPFAHSETDDFVNDGPNNNRPQTSSDGGQALGHGPIGTVEGAKEVMNANWNAPSEEATRTQKANRVKDSLDSTCGYAGISAGSNLASSDGEQKPSMERGTDTAFGLKDAVVSKFDHTDQTTSTDSIPVSQKVSDSGVPVKDLSANAIDSGDEELFSDATAVSAKESEATWPPREAGSEQTNPNDEGKGLSDSITKSISELGIQQPPTDLDKSSSLKACKSI